MARPAKKSQIFVLPGTLWKPQAASTVSVVSRKDLHYILCNCFSAGTRIPMKLQMMLAQVELIHFLQESVKKLISI